MKKVLIATLVLATASGAFASKGFQASLVPDIAIQDRTEEIKGLSIGVWNENPGSQWQIGLVNGATGDSKGFQSFIPFLFFPSFYNYVENYTGVSFAFLNYASGEYVGWQAAVVNVTDDLTGFQLGGVNWAQKATGLQLGVVNYSRTAENLVQVGLVNLIPENKWFADGDFAQGMIIVNWGF